MTQRQIIILIIVSLSIFFEALDIAIVNLAMPLIKNDFGLSDEVVQWMQTLYVLFYGGFLIMGGKLADSLGRKNVFITGTALFMLTSLGAGLAPTFTSLVIFRSIQGLGAALMMPSALSIVTNIFTDPFQRNKAIGIFGSFAAIGSGSGLAIGGLVATWLGWQWIFLINVPIIGIALVFAYVLVPQENKSSITNSPDVVSGMLLTGSILLMTYLVHELIALIGNPVMLLIVTVGCVTLFSLFVNRSRRIENPLIDLSIFKRSRFGLQGNGVFMLMGAFFSGYLFLLPLIMQSDLGFSAAKTGLILVPFSILSAVVSKFILPRILQSISMVQGSYLGMSLMTMGGLTLTLALLLDHNMLLLLLSIFCVTGTGIAVCFTTLTVLAVQDVPKEQHGLATSMINTSFFFGSGLGLGLLGLIIQLAAQQSRIIPAAILTLYAGSGLMVLLMIFYNRVRAPKFQS